MEENQNKDELVQTFLNKNYNFRNEMEEEFKNWIEPYTKEDTPNNEKILSYEIGSTGYNPTFDNSGIIRANVKFSVKTASEDSIWNNYIKGESTYLDYNTCYMEFKVLDEDNYETTYIGAEPKNLKEFQRQFNEYQEQNKEVVVIPANNGNEFNIEQINIISNKITIFSIIVIILSVSFVIFKLIKYKK